MTRRLGLKSSLAALGMGLASPALAHPHVWVTAKAEVVFAPDGKVTGVRHHWTFDEAYTAYVTQGLDTNNDGKLSPEELQDLATENAASLNEFDYFTVLKARGKPQAFDPPREARMSMEKTQVSMSFFLPLKAPAAPSGAVVHRDRGSDLLRLFQPVGGPGVHLARRCAPGLRDQHRQGQAARCHHAADPAGRRRDPDAGYRHRIFQQGHHRMSLTSEPLPFRTPLAHRCGGGSESCWRPSPSSPWRWG